LVAAVRLPSAAAIASIAVATLLALGSLRVRLPKWLGRFVPALMLGAAVGGGWAAALASVAVFGVAWFAYRSRQPNRAPCASCPQRSLKICEGIAPIVKRERAVMRLAHAQIFSWREKVPEGRMRAGRTARCRVLFLAPSPGLRPPSPSRQGDRTISL
jgi:hypothetical protein